MKDVNAILTLICLLLVVAFAVCVGYYATGIIDRLDRIERRLPPPRLGGITAAFGKEAVS